MENELSTLFSLEIHTSDEKGYMAFDEKEKVGSLEK